ncbi:hypothetical protein WJX84_001028 [Apatococcus fuscideae]|uniref:RRM domain-containing protein n=1 Tax=Apatococcus fuscideae TaxID=2026836 RepID=A0AAW1T4V9_9CHLO
MGLFDGLFSNQAQDTKLAALFGKVEQEVGTRGPQLGLVTDAAKAQVGSTHAAEAQQGEVHSPPSKKRQRLQPLPASAEEPTRPSAPAKAKNKPQIASQPAAAQVEKLKRKRTEPAAAVPTEFAVKKMKGACTTAPVPDEAANSDDQAGMELSEEAAAPVPLPSAAADAERLLRTVFVGNLPATILRKTLKQEFAVYGRLETVRLRSQTLAEDSKLPTRVAVRAGQLDSAKGTTHAYLVFTTAEAAQSALAHNMRELEGLHIRVDKASERRASKKEDAGVFYHPGRTLFVGNLPFDATDEEVIRHFNSLQDQLALESPPVTAVRVVREPRTGKGRGIAYVELAAKTAVSGALRLLQGNALRGRELRLERVSTSGPPLAGGSSASGTTGKAGTGRVDAGRAKGAAVNSWQGARTKGQFKQIRPGFCAKPAQATNGMSPRRQARAEMSKQRKSGKRPSVAARKASMKGHIVRPDKKELIRKKELDSVPVNTDSRSII